MSEEVHIYASGLCHTSACAPMTFNGEQVAEAVNAKLPTGLDHGWSISPDETFRTGQPNPCQCEQASDRMHWLLVC